MNIERKPGEQAFQDIYNNFHDKIRRYLARLIGEADSEDVTQEVFLKINAALGNFRCDSSLSTWIYRIATNAATDYLRSSDPSKHAEDIGPADNSDEDSAVDTNTPPPDRQLVRKEMNECIRDIVDRLPQNYRTVLILSDLEELTNSEIADILDISLETVKIRLHRARTRLKKELKLHCDFYRDDRNEFACDRKVYPIEFHNK